MGSYYTNGGLTVEQKLKIVELHKEGKGKRLIARAIGSTEDKVACYMKSSGKFPYLCKDKALRMEAARASGASTKEAARLAEMDKTTAIGVLKHSDANEPAEAALSEQRTYIRKLFPGAGLWAAIGDLHAPQTAWRTLREAQKHIIREKPDGIIHMGDDVNLDAWSKFRKESWSQALDDFKACTEFWDWAVQRWAGNVIYICGSNHEYRLKARLCDGLQSLAMEMGNKIVNRELYDAVERIKHKLFDRPGVVRCDGWWFKLGDADKGVINAHPHNFLAVKHNTGKKTGQWFRKRGVQYGALFIGHVHRYAPPTLDEGRWHGEIPAMCRHMDYMSDPGCRGGDMELGWALQAINKEGQFDVNRSRWFWYPPEDRHQTE